MIRKFLNIETKNITLAATIISVSSLASRILGLIRDRLLAGEFGAGSDLDVYFAAFRIPDFIYNILIAGGVVVAFMPLFFLSGMEGRKASTRSTLRSCQWLQRADLQAHSGRAFRSVPHPRMGCARAWRNAVARRSCHASQLVCLS